MVLFASFGEWFSLIFSLYRFSAGNLRENCEAKSRGQQRRGPALNVAAAPETASAAAPVISHATLNRRVVVSLVKRSATSGRAFLRAVVSILAEVTAFQVILYSPA